MTRGQKSQGEKAKTSRAKPSYPLKDVNSKIAQNKCDITNKALLEAQRDFGWIKKDILNSLKKLRRNQCHKTERSTQSPRVMMDIYHARNLNGENVYTKLYIYNDRLKVISLHELI